MTTHLNAAIDLIEQLAKQQQLSIGLVKPDLSKSLPYLSDWLAQGKHGTMQFLVEHVPLKADPTQLFAEYQSMILIRHAYVHASQLNSNKLLPNHAKTDNLHTNFQTNTNKIFNLPDEKANQQAQAAVISYYARGRDYHKTVKKQLKQFAQSIQEQLPWFNYRLFTDSAPIMEVESAMQAGLGWRGKHTLLVHPKQGSLFFLGGMLCNLPLINEQPQQVVNHCGTCSRCIQACPTGAITEPYKVDARLCIAYLTIEYKGIISDDLKVKIGNHLYGCDDCQLACPWNKFAKVVSDIDYTDRFGYIDSEKLLNFLQWQESTFLQKTEGSAIRRIGFKSWLRNVVIVVGNFIAQLQQQQSSSNNNYQQLQLMDRFKQAILQQKHNLLEDDGLQDACIWALNQIQKAEF